MNEPTPPAPRSVARLTGPDGPLVRAGPARRRPFALRAPGVTVRGNEMDGVEGADLEGRPVVRGLRTGAGVCSNVTVCPRTLRRELVGPGGSVLETLLLSGRPPGLLVQWVPGVAGALALDLSWRHPAPVRSWQASGGTLRVEGPSGTTLHALVPAPDRWQVEPGPEGLSLRARVRSDAGPVTLIVGTGEGAGAQARLETLARAGLHETRAARTLAEARETALALHTGFPEVDDGLEWAKARLASPGPADASGEFPSPKAGGATDSWTWPLLGLLAVGAHRAARALLPDRPNRAAHLLGLGEAVRWTGDPGLLRARLPGLDAAVEELLASPASAAEAVILRAGLRALGDAAEAAGDRARASRWRAAAEDAPTSGDGGAPARQAGSGVRLPLLGDASSGAPDREAERLRAVLLPETASGWTEPTDPPEDTAAEGLRAWALYNAGAPDPAWIHLRRLLAAQEAEAMPGPAAVAGLAAAAVAGGLLGARPDAVYGRIRLAPALPARWTRFRARGLRLGDATLDVAYQRNGGGHTFILVPTAGRVPATAVFEPSVSLTGAVRVEVDGTPAEVELVAGRDRTVARLQLPVDRERRVTLRPAKG